LKEESYMRHVRVGGEGGSDEPRNSEGVSR
jgi:hypothetical protein